MQYIIYYFVNEFSRKYDDAKNDRFAHCINLICLLQFISESMLVEESSYVSLYCSLKISKKFKRSNFWRPAVIRKSTVMPRMNPSLPNDNPPAAS